MAVVKGINQITGTINNVTYYTIQGSDKVYLRRKGGPKKHRIETDPNYAKLRLNNSEWKGCGLMTAKFRLCLRDIKPMEDYPVSGSLNAIFKKIQKTEPELNHGKRSILLSKNKNVLNGFSFSRKQALESILKVPMEASINRESGLVSLAIPAINTRMFLYNFRSLPYFRIVVSSFGVSDVIYSEAEKAYVLEYYAFGAPLFVDKTEWLPTAGVVPAIKIDSQFPEFGPNLPDCVTLIMVVGIEFGKMGDDLIPQTVKYAGSAKVIKVG